MLRRILLGWSLLFLSLAAAANEISRADAALNRGDYAAGIEIFEDLSARGNAEAMARLAALYQRGEGVDLDVGKAAALYFAAAELGNAEAQFSLGIMYLFGEGVPNDEDWALTYFRLAARQGHVLADRNMRELYRENGIPSPAFDPHDTPATAGEQTTALPGVAADFDGVAYTPTARAVIPSPEIANAAASQDALAASADVAADLNPIIALDAVERPIGETVELPSVDEVRAMRLAQSYGIDVELGEGQALPAAASQGSETVASRAKQAEDFTAAKRALALEHYEPALSRLTLLAEDGYGDAALLLSDMAMRGEGLAQDAAVAMMWRQRAADLGNAEAQYQLAELYMYGRGVARDDAMAITFYRDAARGGHLMAQEKLRVIYTEAGLPMPDFTRPREPIAIYSAAPVAQGSSVDSVDFGDRGGVDLGAEEPRIADTDQRVPGHAMDVAASATKPRISRQSERIVVVESGAPLAVARPENHELIPLSISDSTMRPVAQMASAPDQDLGAMELLAASAPSAGGEVAAKSADGFFTRFKRIFAGGPSAVASPGERDEAGSGPHGGQNISVARGDQQTNVDAVNALTVADAGPVASGPGNAPPAVQDELAGEPTALELIAVDPNFEAAVSEPAAAASATIEDGKRALAEGRFVDAADVFTRLAEDGDAEAQAHIGYMYYKGEGVEVNLSRAVEWYRLAAEQRNRDAQYNLAVAYAFGEGVAQDDVHAVLWYRRAAEQGSAIAQYSLGVSYALGEGVARDEVEAIRWYRSAAEQGHAGAQYNLGYSYRSGHGIEANDAEALRWYAAAAGNGHAAAQYSLGYMYRSGKGVTRDLDEAIKWYRLAAAQGHPDARADLASINTEDF